MLLGYQIPFQGGDEERNRKQKVQTEMHNAKIDHLVWNVLANGLSELTDEENEVVGLLHKVFYDAKKRSGPPAGKRINWTASMAASRRTTRP